MTTERIDELANDLRRLSVNLPRALAEVTVPAVVLDKKGVVRWMNGVALEAFGDRRGEHYSVMVAPESRKLVQAQFARKIIGNARSTAYEAVFLAPDGRRFHVDIDSVRLEDQGEAVGVFGLAEVENPADAEASREAHLTPRQLEVLKLLAAGCSTESIANRLHLSKATVRNHVRNVLQTLGARSRLEAVVRARELGIV